MGTVGWHGEGSQILGVLEISQQLGQNKTPVCHLPAFELWVPSEVPKCLS